MGDELCTGGREEARRWSATVSGAVAETAAPGVEAVQALRALAAAVATLELGGLIGGSAAADCAAALWTRLERARLEGAEAAAAVDGADRMLRAVEGEVACRVAGR